MNVGITISENAQHHVKQTITWNSKTQEQSVVRDNIKSIISAWKEKVSIFPHGGVQCKYLDDPAFQEMLQGDYRFVYELMELASDEVEVDLHIFCHQQMDYQTLLKRAKRFT
ncbi:hypothetical protein [Colwellia psychrerythraea]|uniref:Plasmid stabilization system n=1 Tax=Colwellia psychrerythraea TaxID=28229 RepID=A0A099KDG9_COLPS|nr:hypothetical protein [Colwellia psychrerythraea]KGJ88375.1 hypothetical protein ND2E_4211 [Colwellia psychrerythraea]